MTDTVNVPLDVVADAIDCFWNAALGAAHERQSEVAADLASVMVQGFAAIATRLREHAAAPKDDRTETCVKCCGNGEIVTDWEEYLSPPEGAPADHATADCPACDGIGKVHPVYTNPAPSSELLEVAEALIPIARKDTRLGKAGDNLRKALNRLEDAIAKHKGPQS